MKVVDTCDLCSRRGIIWSNKDNTRICKKCNNRIELDLLLNAPPETEDDTRWIKKLKNQLRKNAMI